MTDAIGRGYCGGGSIAAILGLSPFSSPLQAYLEITGELHEELSPEKRKFFDRRKALEPFACQCFEVATGVEIDQINERYTDKEFPWAKAEIDAECLREGERVNIEIKTIRTDMAWMWGDPDSDEPPYYVTAQAMWGLGVTGRDICYVHGLVGIDDDRIYVVERNDKIIANIREHARRFWENYVVPRRQPAPTTDEDLKRLYKRDSGRSVEASTAIQMALSERDIAVRNIKKHENNKKLQELEIKMFMRDATTLTVDGMDVATWKANINGTRILRFK